MVVVRELSNLFNVGTGSAESVEDGLEISTVLHRDDSKLILLVDPHQESFVLVMEDASAVGPISVETNCLKESVTLFEEEVVVNELLPLLLSHVVQRIIGARKIASEALKCLHNVLFDLKSLFIGDARAKRETFKVTPNPDSGALNHCGIFTSKGRSNELGSVHITGMLGGLAVLVVVFDDLIKEVLEN